MSKLIFAAFILSVVIDSAALAFNVREGNLKGVPRFLPEYSVTKTDTSFILWGGGWPTGSRPFKLDDRVVYQPDQESWQPLEFNDFWSPPNIDALITYVGGRLFVGHGARLGGGGTAPLASLYNFTSQKWTPAVDQEKIPVYFEGRSTAIDVDGKLFVFAPTQGEHAYHTNSGFILDPSDGRWRSIASPPPQLMRPERININAVATGKEVILWSGSCVNSSCGPRNYKNGAIYNIETNTWRTINSVNSPFLRTWRHDQLWNGRQLFVFDHNWDRESSTGRTTAGGIYDYKTDAWTDLNAYPNLIKLGSSFKRYRFDQIDLNTAIFLGETTDTGKLQLFIYDLTKDHVIEVKTSLLDQFKLKGEYGSDMSLPMLATTKRKAVIGGYVNNKRDQKILIVDL